MGGFFMSERMKEIHLFWNANDLSYPKKCFGGRRNLGGVGGEGGARGDKKMKGR
jgi:hypothetical protein